MLSRWARMGVLAGMLGGFCLPLSANTTAASAGDGNLPHHQPRQFPSQATSLQLAQTDLSISRVPPSVPQPTPLQIALFLPLTSEVLREAADAVRAGVQAAHERDPDGVHLRLVDSGDAGLDIAERYRIAAEQADLVIGPLSRGAVAAVAQAVAQAGGIGKPTIALAAPEIPPGTSFSMPPRMLVMGLAIEDEARQVADWAGSDNVAKKAVVLHAGASWQRRAAKAFESQWLRQLTQPRQPRQRRELQTVELAADGLLNGRILLQLKKELAETPAVIFAALDAQQARQVRAVLGPQLPLYGTSQLNPVALSSRGNGERMADMDGVFLLDIPWQLDAGHAMVAFHARAATAVTAAEAPRGADMERLYALGIDAYRVAREVAAQQGDFELDGVTGRLTVQIDERQSRLQRSAERAVYRDGGVVLLEARR